jgi:hypothetical protein
MKRTLLIAVGLLAIAGCNNPAPADQTAQGTPAAVPTSSSDTNPAACSEAPGYNPFPQGIAPAFAYHLRSDRLYVHKNGKNRRRLTIEFLDGDANAALASFEQSMSAAGFKARPRKDGADGRITTPFAKKGFGTVIATAIPSPGPNPANPAAKGVLSIDYPMDTDVAATTAQPPANG